MYLVSDESHKPVCTFDDIDKALSCIARWHQASTRFLELEQINKTTIHKVLLMKSSFDLEKEEKILGYITEGIIHNPSF